MELAMRIWIPRRLRPILAGIVVLVLSGGAAFAGQPSDVPVDGRAVAAERSGHDIPPVNAAPTVEDEDGDEEADEDAEVEESEVEESEVDEDAEPEDEGDHCVDPATLTPEVL